MTEPTTAPTETTTPAAPSLEAVAAQVWGSETSETAPSAETESKDAAATELAEGAASGGESAEDKPKAEKTTAGRIAAAKKAEARVERERAEIRAQRAEIDRLKADHDQREKKLKLIEEDPVRFFEEYKADPKAFLERLANVQKPEAVQERKVTAVEEELKALREEITRRDRETENRRALEQQVALEREAGSAFVAYVGEAADKYPHLTQEFTEDEAVQTAFAVLNEVVGRDREGKPVTRVAAYHAEHGVFPDHDVIAEHLEMVAKDRIERRAKSAWRKQGDAPQASQANPNGESMRAPSAKGTGPRTLSRADTSQRAAAPRVAWSQEAADEESIRILEAAFRKHG